MKIIQSIVVALILLVTPMTTFAQLTGPQGGTGVLGVANGSIPFGSTSLLRLATSSAFQYSSSLSRLTVTNASTTALSATTICLTGDTCRTTWPAAGGSTVYLASTSPFTTGNLAYVTGPGTLGSVATGTLTENVTGLEFDATRALIGGASILSLTSGYTIPTSTGLANLYANSHAAVTLSGALDYITLVGQDIVRGAIDLATDITGVLADDNGGTGQSTYSTGDTLYASGANTLAKLTIGSTGNVLSVVGGVPAWVATSTLGLGGGGGGSGTVNSGTSGQVAYYASAGTAVTGTSSIIISTSTGFVGISSTTPGSQLAVNGTTTATGYRATNLTASRAVFTNATSDLVPTAASAALLNSLTDETGTGVAVFGTAPTFTTRLTTPIVLGGTAVTQSLILQSTSGVGTQDRISFLVGNNGATEAMRINNNGNISIATTTATSSRLTVVGASSGTVLSFLSNIGQAWMTMLNTGVTTLLGAWDFGGADSLEIPNGLAPVVDAIGDIALDSTDNQLLIATSTAAGAPGVIPITQSLGSFLISSTSQPFSAGFVTGVAIPFKIHRDGYTVTEIHCDIDGGTSIVINFDNGTGNTSTVTCDTDGASLVGVGSNAVVTAGSVSTAVETGTVTGSPNYLRVSVFGVYTRE